MNDDGSCSPEAIRLLDALSSEGDGSCDKGMVKQRPTFLAGAPAAFSRWESKDADAASEAPDLERAGGELPRTNSKTSLSGSMSHRMSAADRWKNYAAQLVYSPAAKFYYAFMIAVTLFEICVTLYDPHDLPHTRWFLGIELFMVAMLMNEVILRYIADGSPKTFFRSRSNVFDLLVAKVCLGTVIFVIINPYAFTGLQEWIPVAAVRVRDTLRLLRLVFLIKNQRTAQLHAGASMVHLRLDLHDDHHMGDTSMFEREDAPSRWSEDLLAPQAQSQPLLSPALSSQPSGMGLLAPWSPGKAAGGEGSPRLSPPL